jgi:hypothetical protein
LPPQEQSDISWKAAVSMMVAFFIIVSFAIICNDIMVMHLGKIVLIFARR